jgi:hypothetical protein
MIVSTHPLIRDVVGHARVFTTLDLRGEYHQLSIREEDKAKIAFWGVNSHGKDCFVSVEVLTLWVEERTC